MTDTPLWLDAFPHDFEAAHERTLRGLSKVPERVYYPGARRDGGRDGAWLRITSSTGRTWTGVFASRLVEGQLSVVASWPEPHTLFVAVGDEPYLVDTRDPDAWSRLPARAARLRPAPRAAASRCCWTPTSLAAYDADGLAWESDPVGARRRAARHARRRGPPAVRRRCCTGSRCGTAGRRREAASW